MPSFWTDPASFSARRIRPALAGLARGCRGILAPLVAYIGVLALLATAGIYIWDQLPAAAPTEPAAKPAWSLASRPSAAFAISQFDLLDKTETYQIFRHPEGGRKDVFRWTERDEKPGARPIAELEIYRPGGEFTPSEPPSAGLAARLDPEGTTQLETAGFLDSKFGLVTLLRQAGGTDEARSCRGFIRGVEEPRLQFSGWSCLGDTPAAQRAAIGCMLSRLMLLKAGNDPKLAEFFAHAELQRGSCSAAAPADWLTTAESPGLRGAF
jgi:hypothetical protein